MSRNKSSRWRLMAAFLTIISLLVVSCGPDFADVTNSVSQRDLAVPGYHYGPAAWLDGDLIAFEFGADATTQLRERRLGYFDLSTQEWRELPMPPAALPTGESCGPASYVGNLSRLPNGNLGFTYTCYPASAGIAGVLYQWQPESETLEELQFYAVPFRISRYSFSPDMSGLIQENASGAGLSEKLYRVAGDGPREQILADFQRAREPAWSPDGQTIAFMGTETYPGSHSSTFRRWGQIESLLRYPWDIYLMDAGGDNLRIIQGNVGGGSLQWAPQGRFLSLAGTYKKRPGIWLIDTETSQITLIWPYHTFYDWSPDGRQMVIIELAEENEPVGSVRGGQPIIIDVPFAGQ